MVVRIIKAGSTRESRTAQLPKFNGEDYMLTAGHREVERGVKA
ncbi:MAG: hypothetical protein HW390_3451 [Candidatus Brocadiaceae bacterium]|jgi:hypothetical protein|nr:hypothetical protein [Candidatus Brocadiaceae bacterium]